MKSYCIIFTLEPLPPATGAVRFNIRPNKLSSDDLSLMDDAKMIAVCALLPPMGMLA